MSLEKNHTQATWYAIYYDTLKIKYNVVQTVRHKHLLLRLSLKYRENLALFTSYLVYLFVISLAYF